MSHDYQGTSLAWRGDYATLYLVRPSEGATIPDTLEPPKITPVQALTVTRLEMSISPTQSFAETLNSQRVFHLRSLFSRLRSFITATWQNQTCQPLRIFSGVVNASTTNLRPNFIEEIGRPNPTYLVDNPKRSLCRSFKNSGQKALIQHLSNPQSLPRPHVLKRTKKQRKEKKITKNSSTDTEAS